MFKEDLVRKGRQILYFALEVKLRIQEVKWFCLRFQNTWTHASISKPWTWLLVPASVDWLWAGQDHQSKCGSDSELQVLLTKCLELFY